MTWQTKFVPRLDPQVHPTIRDGFEQIERDLKALAREIKPGGTTVVTVGSGGGGGGGGGGSSVKVAFVITQAVSAGTFTVTFAAVGNANYGVISILQNANGDFSFATPQIPPLTDTRGLTQVNCVAQESGTAYTFIILP